jgi:aspartyl-tRNA(Asn)/glutamyl-tRNA(Gln) amidotransferase subunit C
MDLTPEELERFTEELARIVDYIDQIKQVNTSGIILHNRPVKSEDLLREDVIKPSLLPEEALGNAPDKDDQFFGVPGVIG